MIKKRIVNVRIAIMLMSALFMGLMLTQSPVYGACVTGDTDCDGFTAAQECGTTPFPLWDNLTQSNTVYPGCYNSTSCPGGVIVPAYNANCGTGSGCDPVSGASLAPSCLSATSKELFVIMHTATSGSLITPNIPYPFNMIYSGSSVFGAGNQIFPHLISAPQVYETNPTGAAFDRCISTNGVSVTNTSPASACLQRAVRIWEVTGSSGGSLGYTPIIGPANMVGSGDAYVYTGEISNLVNQKCGPGVTCNLCTISAGQSKFVCSASNAQKVINKFIEHTIAHEVGHMMNLAQLYSQSYGNHYAPGTGNIIDQTVTYSTKGSTTNWYLGTVYNASDAQYLQLR